jgi:NitT/TauT family transport system substrate-binding protein
VNRRSFVAGLALTSAGAALARPREASALEPVRVGTMPADFGAQAFYASDLGMFERAGYAVDITVLPNGGVIGAALVSGALDVGYTNVLSLAVAHQQGLPFTVLAGANLYQAEAPTVGIVGVARASALKSARDFNGKTIGVASLHNIQEFGTRNWIDAGGGDSSTVKFIELPNPSIGPAVIAGRIDAGIMNQGDYPTLGRPDDPIRVVGNAFSSIAPAFLSGIWFTTTGWASDHLATAKGVGNVLNAAARWGNAHHLASADILARHINQSAVAIGKITRVVYSPTVTPELLQPSIDLAAKYHALKASFPARDLISPAAS